MLQYFSEMLGYASIAFQWLWNIISSLGFFLELIEYAVALPVYLVALFPPIVSSAIIAFMIVWIVKAIFGR